MVHNWLMIVNDGISYGIIHSRNGALVSTCKWYTPGHCKISGAAGVESVPGAASSRSLNFLWAKQGIEVE